MTTVVERTRQLIAVDSVSHRSNLPLLDLVEETLKAQSHRWRVRRHTYSGRSGVPQGNLVAMLPGSSGSETGGLALCGHGDTVPWQPGSAATTHASQEGALLFGRGACDMKGAIAAMTLACAWAAGRTTPLRQPVWLLVTAEEEIGCLGAKQLEASHLPAAMALIGEPTSLEPVRMHKGYLGAEVQVRGRACHSSRPSLGANALYPACAMILGLQQLALELQAEGLSANRLAGCAELWTPPYATLNVGLQRSGSARNVVPEESNFTVEVRPLPGQAVDDLKRRVIAVLERELPKACELSWTWTTADPAMCTLPEAAVTQLAETLTQCKAGAVSFGTEGKELNALGIPSIIVGPGSIDVAHTDGEYVPLDELEAAVDLYRRAIESVCA